MSTMAPAPASAPAASGQPAPATASPAPGGGNAAEPVQPQAPSPAPPPPAEPAQASKRLGEVLPGVMADPTLNVDVPIKSKRDGQGEGPANQQANQRDDKGRFAKPAAGTEGADPGITPPAEQASPVPPPPVETPTGKYKFAGMEFDSEEHATRTFHTFRGQATKVNQVITEKANADQVAWQWRRAAEEAHAKLQAYERGQQPPPSTVTSPAGNQAPEPGSMTAAEKKSLVQTFDWQGYNQIASDPKYGPAVANAMLADAIEKMVDARVAAVQQPITHAVESQKQAHEAQKLWTEAASYVDPASGAVAFPELSDQASGDRIVDIWMRNNPTHQQRLNPNSLYWAVLQYRDEQRRAGHSTPSATPPPAPPDLSAMAPGVTPPSKGQAVTGPSLTAPSERSVTPEPPGDKLSAFKRGVRKAGLFDSGIPGVSA